MELIDTHCHVHEAQANLAAGDPVREKWLNGGKGDADAIIRDANNAGVTQLVCVGTDVADSMVAVNFVRTRPGTWASIGIHPHEAERYVNNKGSLDEFARLAAEPKIESKVIAVGECGLDYYYNHSSKVAQEKILRFQIELALQHDLPLIFHIRDAFDDFWPIYDSYVDSYGASNSATSTKLRGVVHSFSAGSHELDDVLARGLYVGLNGIMTFTKDISPRGQLAAAKAVPLDKLLLETDAPYLTPAPYRGKMCEPKHVRVTMEFLAALREESGPELAAATTTNARQLFDLHG